MDKFHVDMNKLCIVASFPFPKNFFFTYLYCSRSYDFVSPFDESCSLQSGRSCRRVGVVDVVEAIIARFFLLVLRCVLHSSIARLTTKY